MLNRVMNVVILACGKTGATCLAEDSKNEMYSIIMSDKL